MHRSMIRASALVLTVACAAVQAWTLPDDGATLDRAAAQQILSAPDAPQPTSGFRQQVEMIDFDSHGQRYTQVVVTLVRCCRWCTA